MKHDGVKDTVGVEAENCTCGCCCGCGAVSTCWILGLSCCGDGCGLFPIIPAAA